MRGAYWLQLPTMAAGCRRDLTQEVPDFLLIVRAADIERDSRILVGVIDEMGEGSNSLCHGHGVFRYNHVGKASSLGRRWRGGFTITFPTVSFSSIRSS